MSDENTFDFALYLGTTTPLTITGAGVKDDAALADNPHRFSRYDGDSTRSVMNQHHFTSNGARPRSTSALTCKSSASSLISFTLKAIRPVHFCETVDREHCNVSATSACVRPLSPIRRFTLSPTVGESTNIFFTLLSNHEIVRSARPACRILSFSLVSLTYVL